MRANSDCTILRGLKRITRVRRLDQQGLEKACELYADGVGLLLRHASSVHCFTEIHSITDRILTTFDAGAAHEAWDPSKPAVM